MMMGADWQGEVFNKTAFIIIILYLKNVCTKG